jgi:uncharacterized protein YraI
MTVISRCLAATAALALMTGAAAAATAVSQRDLNMRTGPGTGYAVVMTIPGGAPVEVLDCSGSWCRVAFGGRQGYASRAYLGQGGAAYGAYEAPDEGYVDSPSYVYADDYPYYDYGYSYGPTVGFGFGGHRRHYRHGYRHDGRNWDRGSPGRGGTATLPPGTAIEPGGTEAAAIQALRSGRTPPPSALSPPARSGPAFSPPVARSAPVTAPAAGRAIEPGGGEAGAILRARGGR